MGASCCTKRDTVKTTNKKNPISRRGSMILEKYSRVQDYKKKYEYISMLGNGGFGKVRLYRDKHNKNLKFAIKTLKKDHLNTHNLKLLEEEVKILRELDHPNIVKYFETYEDEFYINIVMEYIAGDNLFKVIANRLYNHFTEHDAAEIICQLCRAVLFLHKNNVVHRDIKPENILFGMSGKYASLKLIDFGLSIAATKQKERYRVGSPFYMSPEMLDGKFTFSSDVWSIGVILYVMMTGVHPFPGKTQEEVFANISKCEYDRKILERQRCSEEIKELIKNLLKKNPDERLSIEEVLDHKWMQLNHTHSEVGVTNMFDENILESIRSFAFNNPLQKEILFYLAKISNETEILKLKQAFLQIDTDNTGTLEVEEIFEVFKKLGLEPDKVGYELIYGLYMVYI